MIYWKKRGNKMKKIKYTENEIKKVSDLLFSLEISQTESNEIFDSQGNYNFVTEVKNSEPNSVSGNNSPIYISNVIL